MNIQELIQKGESRTLEFKEKLPKSESLAKTAVAFANGAGGKMLIGVEDKTQKIKGLSDQECSEYTDKIINIIFDLCSPLIRPEIYRYSVDGKGILVVDIFPGGNLPYYLRKEGKGNGVYVRIGSHNKKAGIEQIQELERKSRNISFDEIEDIDAEITDLDLEKLKVDFYNYTDKKLTENDLINLKILKKNGNAEIPTVGGYLLAGKNPDKYFQSAVKCARFKGTTTDIFIDQKEFRGPLYEQVENTVKFLMTHIELSGQLEGIQRVDKYAIPIKALREAVVNAIIHRDYSISGADIKVAVFDDIVEITSPGTMPGALAIDDIGNGRSEIRNKVIARFFNEINFIEQWGTGFKKIFGWCKDASLDTPKLYHAKNLW